MLTVVFRVGNQAYGIAADCVHEIVLRPALVTPSGADPVLHGLLNLHGRFIPVLDGGRLFTSGQITALNSHLMLLGDSQPELGLLVAEVTDVVELALSQATPLKRGSASPLLRRITQAGSAAVLLTDLPALRGQLAVTAPEELAA